VYCYIFKLTVFWWELNQWNRLGLIKISSYVRSYSYMGVTRHELYVIWKEAAMIRFLQIYGYVYTLKVA
jgi:hypothetical protein